jgi:hypothetical protein
VQDGRERRGMVVEGEWCEVHSCVWCKTGYREREWGIWYCARCYIHTLPRREVQCDARTSRRDEECDTRTSQRDEVGAVISGFSPTPVVRRKSVAVGGEKAVGTGDRELKGILKNYPGAP